LLNQCPACKSNLGWQRPAICECRCGIDLRDFATEHADKDLVAINTVIYHAAAFPLADEAKYDLAAYNFAAEMLKLRLGSLLRLVLWGGSIEKGRLCSKQKVEPRNLDAATEICRAAVTTLRDWPVPFLEALRNMLPPHSDNPDTLKFGRIFGAFYRYLYQDFPRREFGFLLNVFERLVIEDWKGFIRGGHHRPRYFSRAVLQNSRWVTVSEAAKLASVSCRRILDCIRRGQIENMLLTRPDGAKYIKRESMERWIATRNLEIAHYMSLSEAKGILGLSRRSIITLGQAGLIHYVKGYDHLFASGYHFLRDDVMKIVRSFDKYSVPWRKYTYAGKLIALGDAVIYFGHDVLPDLIRAVGAGELVPVAYAKLSHGISGYLFPTEKLETYQREIKVLPRRLRNQNEATPNFGLCQTNTAPASSP
jgi:hypothetical protein